MGAYEDAINASMQAPKSPLDAAIMAAAAQPQPVASYAPADTVPPPSMTAVSGPGAAPPDTGAPASAGFADRMTSSYQQQTDAAANTAAGLPSEPAPAAAPMQASQTPSQAGPQASMSPAMLAAMSVHQTGGGGVIPAHEVSLYGPTQLAAIQKARATNEALAGAMQDRSYTQSLVERASANEQALKAQTVVDAQQASMAKREDEASARIADMDKTVAELGKMSVDPNRYWNNAGTGQKIAMVLGMSLGGFVNGASGRPNEALGIINRAVDHDIKAQESAFNMKLQGYGAQKSAYGMLMEKYQNADVARNALRASMMDVVQRQTAQLAAQSKGVDAQNAADTIMGKLAEQQRDYTLSGTKLVQAQATAPQYSWRGMPITAAQAFELQKDEVRAEQERAKEADKAGYSLEEKRLEMAAKQGDQVNQETRFIAEKLNTSDVPGALAASSEALHSLSANKPGYLERTARAAGLGGKAANFVGGTEGGVTAASRQQAISNFKNRAMKVIAGNVTESEEKRIEAGLSGTGSPEEQMNGIRQAQQAIAAIQNNVMAGASPEAQRTYLQRLQTSTAMTGGPPTKVWK